MATALRIHHTYLPRLWTAVALNNTAVFFHVGRNAVAFSMYISNRHEDDRVLYLSLLRSRRRTSYFFVWVLVYPTHRRFNPPSAALKECHKQQMGGRK